MAGSLNEISPSPVSPESAHQARSRDSLWQWLAAGLVISALVRVWLISEIPIAVYSEDSGSYFATAADFWAGEGFHLHEKRTFLYPLLLTVILKLPMPLANSVVILQHFFTLLVPITAGILVGHLRGVRPWLLLPFSLFIGLSAPWLHASHYMSADALYGVAFWIFWLQVWRLLRTEESPAKISALALLAAALSTAIRPEGKLLILAAVPTIALMFLVRWRQVRFVNALAWVALPVVLSGMAWIHAGRATESKKLLFCSVLPLIDLDSPLFAEYKEAIAPHVLKARGDMEGWPRARSKFQGMLTGKKSALLGPLWEALGNRQSDRPRLHALCGALAREAILSHPVQTLHIGWLNTKFILSGDRVGSNLFARESFSGDWTEEADSKPERVQRLLGRTWPETEARIFDAGYDARVAHPLAELQRLTSLKYLGWSGVLALGGWLLAIRRNGWRLAAWSVLFCGYAYVLFLVARGIPRFLLVFEPVLPMGIALLAAEAIILVSLFRRRLSHGGHS